MEAVVGHLEVTDHGKIRVDYKISNLYALVASNNEIMKNRSVRHKALKHVNVPYNKNIV